MATKPLTFKVSAKTARLFGRENASNSEAAVSELIKNTYDADATACLVCFLPRYQSVPAQLSIEEYIYLHGKNEQIEQFYCADSSGPATFRANVRYTHAEMYNVVKQLTDIWIIDNGSGMTAETIEECWMVIGTNDKEVNVISRKGRARTGAKGIGRFALDRLGNRCSLHSSCEVNGKIKSIRWEVDWSEFDKEGKVLDDIAAHLEEEAEPIDEVLTFLSNFPELNTAISKTNICTADWSTGTAIQISFLRDGWERHEFDRLNRTLEALIPPIEQRELDLFLFDASSPEAYGIVSSELLEDFDYKLEANITNENSIIFHMFRNELDSEIIDPELFEQEDLKDPRFCESTFRKGKVSYTETLESLFPGRSEQFFRKMRELGPFKVQLLFYKRGRPSRKDSEKYPYRPFQPGPRKTWLDEFGGIKIYRDNFAVRPYGELNSRAFDWLALGKRVALSPVAASRKGWKVSPQNLAGTVMISRFDNARLNDQTNREGIIENEYFAEFRTVILRIIEEFEDDRSLIHYNLNELYKQKNKSEEAKEAGAVAANRIVGDPGKATAEDAQQLALAFVAQQEEIRELKDEQAMLRALATLGTVLVSFSHEMGQLQNTMGSRSSMMADILTSYISPDEVAGISSPFHPYTILEDWEEDDKRVKQWFTFALTTVRAGRRRRREVSIREHLEATRAIWLGFLQPREVELTIGFEHDEIDARVLAFEIDLDSIFNNLILNSVEAFLSSRHTGDRQINIQVRVEEQHVRINYRDNGPGLHPSIREPSHIFRFAVSTKRGSDGEMSGTGLGMWILSAVVHSYGGTCKVFRRTEQLGFRIELSLPLTGGL